MFGPQAPAAAAGPDCSVRPDAWRAGAWRRLEGCVLLLTVAACATPVQTASAEQRYVQGLQHRFRGDAHGYYETLISLAHDEPDSRAGRRARATLRGSDWLADLALMGILATALVPTYWETAAPDTRQTEAKRQLRTLAELQQRYFASHGYYCQRFLDCGFKAPENTHYVFFLSDSEALTGTDLRVAPGAEPQAAARAALAAYHVAAHVDANGFVAAAVGNLDSDMQLDIWTIDEAVRLVHVFNDVD